MEAAASGLPVIATDIRGCRQVVEPMVNGMLVPVGEIDALAAAIADLATDASLRHAMRAAAIEKALKEFDDHRVIELTLATYDRLCSHRSTTP